MTAFGRNWVSAGVVLFVLAACSGSGGGSSSGKDGGAGLGGFAGDGGALQGGSGGSAILCVPNQQFSCACGASVQGYQVCKPDGSGYGPCVCPDAGNGGSGASGGSSGGGTGASGGANHGGTSGGGGTPGGGGGGSPGGGGSAGCATTSQFVCGSSMCSAPWQYCYGGTCTADTLDCGCNVTCACLPQIIGCTKTVCTPIAGGGFMLSCG